MTREQAIKQLKKLYGAKIYYRVGQHITSPEARATALEELQTLRRQKEYHDKATQERLNELDWYQEANRTRAEMNKRIRALEGQPSYYKFTVGKDLGYAAHVTGVGDTWEEALAQAEAKKEQF